MIINSIKEYHVQHDEALRLLRVEWVGGQDMRHFRRAGQQLQVLAKQLGITKAVLVLDTLPDISAYDQVWLAMHWLPSLLQLSLQQTVIVLSPKQVYNQHAIELLLMGSKIALRTDVQLFTQAVPAMHWLTDESPRLPALLAEWADAYGQSYPYDGVAEPQAMYLRS